MASFSQSDPFLRVGASTPLLLLGWRNPPHRLGPLFGPHLVVRLLLLLLVSLFTDRRRAGSSSSLCALAVVPMPRSRRATFPMLNPRP